MFYDEKKERQVLDEILDSVVDDVSYDNALERLCETYFEDREFEMYFYDRYFSWENQSKIKWGYLDESDAIESAFEHLLFEKDQEAMKGCM